MIGHNIALLIIFQAASIRQVAAVPTASAPTLTIRPGNPNITPTCNVYCPLTICERRCPPGFTAAPTAVECGCPTCGCRTIRTPSVTPPTNRPTTTEEASTTIRTAITIPPSLTRTPTGTWPTNQPTTTEETAITLNLSTTPPPTSTTQTDTLIVGNPNIKPTCKSDIYCPMTICETQCPTGSTAAPTPVECGCPTCGCRAIRTRPSYTLPTIDLTTVEDSSTDLSFPTTTPPILTRTPSGIPPTNGLTTTEETSITFITFTPPTMPPSFTKTPSGIIPTFLPTTIEETAITLTPPTTNRTTATSLPILTIRPTNCPRPVYCLATVCTCPLGLRAVETVPYCGCPVCSCTRPTPALH